MKCNPGCHAYKPLGKVVYCTQCADVQPLLLADDYDVGSIPQPGPEGVRGATARPPAPPPEPASAEELEHAANLLRDAVGIPSPARVPRGTGEQLDLGVRQTLDDEELLRVSNEYSNPRVPVSEGFETDPRDDALLDAGL